MKNFQRTGEEKNRFKFLIGRACESLQRKDLSAVSVVINVVIKISSLLLQETE